jgi:hypothetical protein
VLNFMLAPDRRPERSLHKTYLRAYYPEQNGFMQAVIMAAPEYLGFDGAGELPCTSGGGTLGLRRITHRT